MSKMIHLSFFLLLVLYIIEWVNIVHAKITVSCSFDTLSFVPATNYCWFYLSSHHFP